MAQQCENSSIDEGEPSVGYVAVYPAKAVLAVAGRRLIYQTFSPTFAKLNTSNALTTNKMQATAKDIKFWFTFIAKNANIIEDDGL